MFNLYEAETIRELQHLLEKYAHVKMRSHNRPAKEQQWQYDDVLRYDTEEEYEVEEVYEAEEEYGTAEEYEEFKMDHSDVEVMAEDKNLCALTLFI